MMGYFVKRALQTLIVLFALSFAVYYSLGLMPGDPIELLITSIPNMKPQDEARLKKVYGLDQPIHIRYFKWLKQVTLKGDLGYSRTYKGVRTYDLIKDRIPNSLKLMLASLLLSLLIAVPIGVYSAMKQYSTFDYIANFASFVGISIPSFWLGLMLIIIFAEKLQVFPASGMQTPGYSDFVDKMRYMVLPVIALSVQQIGGWVRYMRSSMLEVVKRDYIRTARAKGVDEDTILFKHALKNALIPVVTIIALSLPGLVGGATITETVFSWPGMGKLLYDSIIGVDYYVAMISFLFLAFLTMIANFLADILYAVVDPRIRHGGK
ncbi:MAG: ABC transporter permease [Deltaproteobacteria bacterium]|nr:ABC transporter permease [Deltaproteobacteria bacterium]